MDGRLETLLPLEVMSSCGGGSLPNEHYIVLHFSTFRAMWLSVVNLLMPSIACCNPLVGGMRGRMTRHCYTVHVLPPVGLVNSYLVYHREENNGPHLGALRHAPK